MALLELLELLALLAHLKTRNHFQKRVSHRSEGYLGGASTYLRYTWDQEEKRTSIKCQGKSKGWNHLLVSHTLLWFQKVSNQYSLNLKESHSNKFWLLLQSRNQALCRHYLRKVEYLRFGSQEVEIKVHLRSLVKSLECPYPISCKHPTLAILYIRSYPQSLLLGYHSYHLHILQKLTIGPHRIKFEYPLPDLIVGTHLNLQVVEAENY